MGHIEKFNQLATTYDTPQNIAMAEKAAQAIRQFIDPDHTQSAIDLGCGTGLVGLQLLDAYDSMLFIDGSEKMIEQVNHKLSELESSKATTLCLDIEQVDTFPQQADAIIMSLVLHHIPDQQALLEKLYTNLNDGGQLFIVEMEGGHHSTDKEKLAKLLEIIGFHTIQTDTFFQDETHIRFTLVAHK